MATSDKVTPSEQDTSSAVTLESQVAVAADRDESSSAEAGQQRRGLLDNLYVSLVLQIGMVIFVYRALLMHPLHNWVLPLPSYVQPSMIMSAARHPPFVILAAMGLLPLALRWKRIRWQDIDENKRTRLFVMVPVAIFAWVCSLYDLNLVYDQSHLDGRILSVLLAVGCWFHPAFVCAFALWCTVVIAQIHQPLLWAEWHWPDKVLPYDTLFLFSAYLHVRAWSRRHSQLFAFLLLVLTGATYAYAAYRKLMIGPTPLYWPLENHFGFLFVGAHLNGGWLRNLPTRDVLEIAALLERISPALGITTIACEGAGIALLWHRRATVPILLAMIGMHVMILLSTGIFFWKWILQNAALCAYVFALNRDARMDPSARPHRALARMPARLVIPAAIALILSAEFAFKPLRFAWLDSPITNYFELRAHGVSGKTYRLDPRFFAPYDLLVNQSRFYYVTRRPVLAEPYASAYSVVSLEALEDARVQDVPAIRERYGKRYWNETAARIFAEFVYRSVRNAQLRGTRSHALAWLKPPYHFQTSLARDTYAFQEPIADVEVRWQEWFYDGKELHHLLDEPVVRVRILP